jgi:hypothetical protein
MWHPNWIGEYNRPKRPNSDKVDWGAAAQQWLKNKEMYETWQQQQQQYQATAAAQSAQSTDPSVITNPPPSTDQVNNLTGAPYSKF